MTLPVGNIESKDWKAARIIVHVMGVCGAGKTTLSSYLAKHVSEQGGQALVTLDYDPLIPDSERASERAFSRELDSLNTAANSQDIVLHGNIEKHALELLESWENSDANVIIVDRWLESYDNLPASSQAQIHAAVEASSFKLIHVLLIVANDVNSTDTQTLTNRMLHTKEHRPESWWLSGPETIEQWVIAEHAYQEQYRQYVRDSAFPSIRICTKGMDWTAYKDEIIHMLTATPQDITR